LRRCGSRRERQLFGSVSGSAKTMPKSADPAWEEHTSETSKVVEKAGIDTTVKGWVCNHCDETVWNRNLQRLLCHLSGDAERCVGERITPCTKVEQDVRDEMAARLDAKAAVKAGNTKRKSELNELADEADGERATLVQSRMVRGKPAEVIEVNGALSDMFDGLGIAHNKVDHPLLHRFVQKVRIAPPDWKLPCRVTLGGSLLDQQYRGGAGILDARRGMRLETSTPPFSLSTRPEARASEPY